ncbi:MAG TPA: carboxylesterase family protein [Acidobacteriaceae bacterium]
MAAAALMMTAWIGTPSELNTSPLVTVESGAVRGSANTALPKGGEFLGIPFAAQPVGPLRWRAPQRPPHWEGARDAKEWGPACPQAPSPWLPEMMGIQKMRTDEACLYLNVWTPELHPQKPLPVFVWVHGGGNVEGSGQWPPLGEALAQHGIVVVSFNYRLGVFGFYASPELDRESAQHVSGNYGHLDQMAALAWVRRNIAAFGGDPTQVTIGGESSGALDVCDLMTSPLAAGLFRGAIMESGVCVDGVDPALRELEAADAGLAKDSGAPAGSERLVALRALPADRIFAAAAKDDALDFGPAVDGWVLPQQPAVAFAKSEQAKVAVLVGSNDAEVSIFVSPMVGGHSWWPKTAAAYRAWAQKKFGPLAEQVLREYPAHTDADVPLVFRTMYTDYDFGFGSWLLAKDASNVGQHAYLYHFTYLGQGPFAELGAFHSEEEMFLSRHYWATWIARPGDAVLSRAIIRYWAQFVKTGNPNGAELPVWPEFGRSGEAQELGRRVGPEGDPRQEKWAVFQEYLNSRLEQLH